MTPALAAVLILLGVVIVLFAIDWPRMDVVALLALFCLPFTGVLTVSESLSGFSDPNIVLIASLFVLGEGFVRTGIARRIGDLLVERAGGSPWRLIALLMAVVSTIGATMSSTAVTAIFIPVAMRISRRTNTPTGQLMMPLSFAALISGMMTLVATAPNLVIHSELVRRGEKGFQFFSFTPFGVPILIVSIAYMLFARRWLPAGSSIPRSVPRPTLANWVERYHLTDRQHRLRVRFGSSLIGRTLDAISLRGSAGVNVIAIHRHGALLQPTGKTQIEPGDVLFVDLFDAKADADALCREFDLEPLPINGQHFVDRSQEIGMAELFIPADSDLVGKTVVKAKFRSRFGVNVVGLQRGGKPVDLRVSSDELRIGDTLLVIGPWRAIRAIQTTAPRDLIALNLPVEFDDVAPAGGKALHAFLIMLLVVGLMAFQVIPNVQAALLGCLLMGACGCIDMEDAYRAIDWKTIVLIVGMLPFSLALQRTGGVEIASDLILSAANVVGPRGVLALLFALTAILGMFISNTATAVLMAPVALTAAKQLGVSPYPFAMIVALASSAAFMTPVSSPVNTLVVTPGGYRFGDFVRIGIPLTFLVLLVSVLLVPLVLPL